MSYFELIANLSQVAPRKKGDGVKVLGLSDEQNKALNAPFTQSAVICAGAGAGKTKLLVERIALLLEAGADPKRVGVVAFTRKSAGEVLKRVKVRLGPKALMPVASTVHALAYALLSKGGESLICLASEEQETQILSELRSLLPPSLVDLSDSELKLLIGRAREDSDTTSAVGLLGRVYEESLARQGLTDFTALLRDAMLKPRDLFDHLIVDEAQDLSQLQLLFLRHIAPRATVWFIGDADQAIYAFRGAHSGMMATLRDATQAVYYLTANYRCASKVLSCANRLIQHNPRPFPVEWRPMRKEVGCVSTLVFETEADEYLQTLAWLQEDPLNRVVLGRTQALVAPYKQLGLPASTVHESKGLEWPEVRIVGCEENLFPHPMAGVQEERRLFYVAMTRAKNHLEVSRCIHRGARSKKPQLESRFLREAEAEGGGSRS